MAAAGMGAKFTSGLRAKRKLKRNSSSSGYPVEIESIACIRGGMRKEWLVLPLEDVNGRSCVCFSQEKCWLHQMVTGFGVVTSKESHRGAIGNLFMECCEAFKNHLGGDGLQPSPLQDHVPAQASSQAGAGNDANGMQMVEIPKKKGRLAILSDSENDSDNHSEEKQSSRKRRRPASTGRRARRGEFVNVELRRKPFTFTVLSGPRVFVPVDGPWVANMIEDLLPRAGEKARKGPVALSQLQPKTWLSEAEKVFIAWRPASRTTADSWAVRYTDKRGVKRWSRRGLVVPRTSMTREPVSDETFLANARAVLVKARRYWNSLDQSDDPRLELSEA